MAEEKSKPTGNRIAYISLGILAFLIIIAAASCSGKKETTQQPTQPTKTTKLKEEAAVPEPEPIELSGTGQQASEKFTLENGISIFRMTHSGSSNFAIKLLDSDGKHVDLLVNEIGKFDGAKAVGISKKGKYILDISANGKWTVKIEQPRLTTADPKPETFTGTGQQVSAFIKLDKGLTTFKLKHIGKSNFAVVLMDKKGNREELLVNEIGDFDGSKAVGISRSGIYLLDISADGDWSISVE